MGSDQKRLFLAFSLSAIILFGWQYFFAPKPVVQKTVEQETVPVKTDEALVKAEGPAFEKESKTLSNSGYDYTFLNDFSLGSTKNPKAKATFEEVAGNSAPFSIQLIKNQKAEVLKVNFTKVSESELLGDIEGQDIKVRASVGENGRLSIALNSTTPQRYRLIFKSAHAQGENRKSREFIFLMKGTERHAVDKSFQEEEKIKWVGIDYNFHLVSFIFPEKLQGKAIGDEKGEMIVDLAAPTTEFKGDFLFTIKNYDELALMGDNLKLSVDFGVFGILAVPILRGLQFFYKYIPNYGWSIVLLTLLIRLITYPLQYKSFKSMKKMQEIQPELTKIKEKYKDDAQRMQKETMALFKKAGANPLGGCLPILIQMPVFFAFYKVLGEAIELVGAPYILWIKDLSHKDPYFVLPVLMAAAMFFQQKFTPTTVADPTQKKIMMFMPLIFGFIMKDLPSGLVLYIFVSTLFGMVQQLYVYKTTA